MLDDEVIALAHREAWRYKKSSDPNHSDTYTFNRATLLEFARKLEEAEREACAEIADTFPTLYGFHSCFSVAGEIRKRQ